MDITDVDGDIFSLVSSTTLDANSTTIYLWGDDSGTNNQTIYSDTGFWAGNDRSDDLVDDLDLATWPEGEMFLKVHHHHEPAPPDWEDLPANNPKTMPSLHLNVTDPIIIRGRPMNPWLYSTEPAIAYTLRQDPGHIHSSSSPDPPDSGYGDARWTCKGLDDPALHGGEYPLGKIAHQDRSLHLPSSCWQWSPDATTPTAPPWHSQFPFKPYVMPYKHINKDGTTYLVQRALHFHPHQVQHMWLDFGAPKRMPFTWMIAAIIFHREERTSRSTLLDGGKSPFTYRSNFYSTAYTTDQQAQPNIFYQEEWAAGIDDVKLKKNPERQYYAVDQNHVYMSNEFFHKRLVGHHPPARKPRVYWGIWNGAHSYLGNWHHDNRRTTKGKLHEENFTHQYYLMGRQLHQVIPHHGSDMIVLEMRFWHSALSYPSDIEDQYKVLSTEWQFHRFE